jgi:hypothetical protein
LPHDGGAVSVRIAHHGVGPLRGTLELACPEVEVTASYAIDLAPGQVSAPFVLTMPPTSGPLARVRVNAKLTGSHPAENHWALWRVPPWHDQGLAHHAVDALTPAVLDRLEAGGTVLLHAGPRAGSLATEALWTLRGAPFAPDHPAHERIPRDLLLELSSFDLESGRVMPWDLLRDQVDPILAFWETHDIPEVRFHLLAFDCRVGKGRLLATTLRLADADATVGSLGFHVRHLLLEHLVGGPAPRRALRPETIAALRAVLAEQRLDLPVWRFRTDPQDEGRAAGWMRADHDPAVAPWRELKAGSHWENQADDLKHYTGVAWYRCDVDVPAGWQGQAARAVFEGVDDSFELWLDGEPVARFGDPATNTTVWLERQVAELGARLTPGRHSLVLRVVDHAGAGGLWKPVFLTTGPTDAGSRLLHR